METFLHARTGYAGLSSLPLLLGLYDEPMQKEEYGIPKEPELDDAKRLFEWVLGSEPDNDHVIPLPRGSKVDIIGEAPRSER